MPKVGNLNVHIGNCSAYKLLISHVCCFEVEVILGSRICVLQTFILENKHFVYRAHKLQNI